MQRPYLRKEVGMFALLFQTTIGWLDVLLDSLVFGLAVGYVLYKSRASLASRLFKRGVKEFRGFRRCFERSQLFSMPSDDPEAQAREELLFSLAGFERRSLPCDRCATEFPVVTRQNIDMLTDNGTWTCPSCMTGCVPTCDKEEHTHLYEWTVSPLVDNEKIPADAHIRFIWMHGARPDIPIHMESGDAVGSMPMQIGSEVAAALYIGYVAGQDLPQNLVNELKEAFSE